MNISVRITDERLSITLILSCLIRSLIQIVIVGSRLSTAAIAPSTTHSAEPFALVGGHDSDDEEDKEEDGGVVRICFHVVDERSRCREELSDERFLLGFSSFNKPLILILYNGSWWLVVHLFNIVFLIDIVFSGIGIYILLDAPLD